MKSLIKFLLISLFVLAGKTAYAIDMDSYDNWRSSEICGSFGANNQLGISTVSATVYEIYASSASTGGTFQIHNATSVASYRSTGTVHLVTTVPTVYPVRTRFNRGFFLTVNGSPCFVVKFEYTNTIPLGREENGKY